MDIGLRFVAAGVFAMSAFATLMPAMAVGRLSLGQSGLGNYVRPASGLSADRRLRIINGSNETLNQFYASNAGRGGGEEDALGNSVVPAGQTMVINIDDSNG